MGCGSSARKNVLDNSTVPDQALRQQLSEWEADDALPFLAGIGVRKNDDLQYLKESDLNTLEPLLLRRKLWACIQRLSQNVPEPAHQPQVTNQASIPATTSTAAADPAPPIIAHPEVTADDPPKPSSGLPDQDSKPQAQPKESRVLNEPGKWDYFLSHVQRESGWEANDLFHKLGGTYRGRAWLDVKMVDKGAKAMEEGVNRCSVFLCILSNSYLDSEYCRMELTWAYQYKKPIIVSHIKKTDRLGPIFKKAAELGFPSLGETESIELHLKDPELAAVTVNKIETRAQKLGVRTTEELASQQSQTWDDEEEQALDSTWVTVQFAGVLELKNWPPDTAKVGTRFLEHIPKRGSPYSKDGEEYPYPEHQRQGEAEAVEHQRSLVFASGRIKPLAQRRVLHTSVPRAEAARVANAFRPSQTWGAPLERALPGKAGEGRQGAWREAKAPAEVLRQCRCGAPQDTATGAGGCSAEACGVQGTVIESRGGRVQCREREGAGPRGAGAREGGEAWVVSWEARGDRAALAGRVAGSPLWVLYVSKYGDCRPALQRFECGGRCGRKLRGSSFGMAGMFTREELCRDCRPKAAAATKTTEAEAEAEARGGAAAGEAEARGGAAAGEAAARRQGSQKEVAHGAAVDAGAKGEVELEVVVAVDELQEVFGQHAALLRERAAQNRELTVFLSSPFQGLLHERMLLVGRYLPQLTALCEARGISLRVVDLRWGITSAMAENNLVVLTCLDAMEGSDVFVGFYGQRYGASMLQEGNTWMQPSLEKAYGSHPWLQHLAPHREDGTTLRAVTDLEFQAGFNDAHRRGGSAHAEGARGPVVGYGFFRNAGFDEAEMARSAAEAWKYRPENEESASRLQALREESVAWARRGRGAVYRYSEPKHFAQRAFKDLERLLRLALPDEGGEEETLVHANHIKVLTKAYAAQPAPEAEVAEYLASTSSKPMAVTAMPGGGKSSLLAQVVRDQQAQPDWASIFHFVGIDARSTQLSYMLERLMLQVAALVNASERDKERALRLPLNKQLGWVLEHWQQQGTGKKLLIVVDALNELEDEVLEDEKSAHELEWLLRKSPSGVPQPLPGRVKVIVSSLGQCPEYPSGQALKVMTESKFQMVKLQPVRAEQCKELVEKLLQHNFKKLDKSFNVLPILTSTPSRANPLFITLFVWEMVSFNGYKVSHGVVEQLEDYFNELKTASTTSEMLDIVLGRLETLHTAPELIAPLCVGSAVEVGPDSSQLDTVAGTRSLLRVRMAAASKLGLVENGCRVALPGYADPVRVVAVLSPTEFLVEVESTGEAAKGGGAGEVMLVRPALVAWVMKLIWASKEGLTPMELQQLATLLVHEAGLRLRQNEWGAEGAGGDRRSLNKPHVGAEVQILDAAGAVKRTGTITGMGKQMRVSCGEEELWVPSARLKVISSKAGEIEQENLTPLIASMHRMLSKNSGLLNFGHDYVRQAVEKKYLGFSQGRVAAVTPMSSRKAAEASVSRLHSTMAEFFKEKAEADQSSLLQELPRAIREKNHHEALSGKKPSLLVVARVRPFIHREIEEGLSDVFVSVNKKQMCLVDPVSGRPKAVTLDCCLSKDEVQADVWRRAGGSELVDKILEGYNVSVLAYGQTGSGKTYTMFGDHGEGDVQLGGEEKGLIPRLIGQLLQKLERKTQVESGLAFAVEISAVEVYMDTVRDLLSEHVTLVRVLDGQKGTAMPGLTRRAVTVSKDAVGIVKDAFLRRKVRGTSMNDYSSRSHILVTIHIRQTIQRPEGHLVLRSEVNLVDLAGSERGRTRKKDADFWVGAQEAEAAKRGAKKEEEATSINKSLRVLQGVIAGLAAGHKHVPYKESKLTRILSNSLGGNALTVLLTTLSPSPKDFSETSNTLVYAREAKKILNKAAQNAEEELVEKATQSREPEPAPVPDAATEVDAEADTETAAANQESGQDESAESEAQNQAAVKIQCKLRVHRARRRFAQEAAAVKIEKAWRMYEARKKMAAARAHSEVTRWKSDLQEVMHRQDGGLTQVLKDMDGNGDGKISQREFLKAVANIDSEIKLTQVDSKLLYQHLLETSEGGADKNHLTLEEAAKLFGGGGTSGTPASPPETQEWAPVQFKEDEYEVSSSTETSQTFKNKSGRTVLLLSNVAAASGVLCWKFKTTSSAEWGIVPESRAAENNFLREAASVGLRSRSSGSLPPCKVKGWIEMRCDLDARKVTFVFEGEEPAIEQELAVDEPVRLGMSVFGGGTVEILRAPAGE